MEQTRRSGRLKTKGIATGGPTIKKRKVVDSDSKRQSKRAHVDESSDSDFVKPMRKVSKKSPSRKGWKRLINEGNIADHKFSFYGSFEKFEGEVDMSEEEKDMFGKSCFGKFLNLPKVIRSSRIINNLLSRVGRFEGVEDENSLQIELGGIPRAFTIQQFSEITGLRIVENYIPPVVEVVEGGVYYDVNKNGTVKSRAGLAAFLHTTQSWEMEKRVKFYLVHFLVTVLLSAPGHTNVPDWTFVKMVDHFEVFNSHPWGNVVWKYFVDAVQKFLKNSGGKAASKGKINFSSFLYPLQIWAYETMPILTALHYCVRVSPSEQPLMRRWKTDVSFVNDAFHKTNFQSPKFVFNNLGVSKTSSRRCLIEDSTREVAARTPETPTSPQSFLDTDAEARLKSVEHTVKGLKATVKGLKVELTSFKAKMKEMFEDFKHSVRDQLPIAYAGPVEPVVQDDEVDKEEEKQEEEGEQEAEKKDEDDDDEKPEDEVDKPEKNDEDDDDEKHEEAEEEAVEKEAEVQKEAEEKEAAVQEEDEAQGNEAEGPFGTQESYVSSKWLTDSQLESLNKDYGGRTLSQLTQCCSSKEGAEAATPPSSPVVIPDDSLTAMSQAIVIHVGSGTTMSQAVVIPEESSRPSRKVRSPKRYTPSPPSAIFKYFLNKYTKPLKNPLSNPCTTPPLEDAKIMKSWLKVNKLKKKNKEGVWYKTEEDVLGGKWDFSVLEVVSKTFFYLLWTPEQWLSDQHVDVVSYYLRKKRWFGELETSFTIMNCHFASYLEHTCSVWIATTNKDDFDWSQHARIIDHVTGCSKSMLYTWSWCTVKDVYMPLCSQELGHWLLLVLNIADRSLTVYDSMSDNKYHVSQITPVVKRFADFIPVILTYLNVFDNLGIEDTSSSSFFVKFHEPMPQQDNGGDCGMFVVKAMDYMVHGESVGRVRQEDISNYRQQLCIDLFRHGWLKTAKGVGSDTEM